MELQLRHVGLSIVISLIVDSVGWGWSARTFESFDRSSPRKGALRFVDGTGMFVSHSVRIRQGLGYIKLNREQAISIDHRLD